MKYSVEGYNYYDKNSNTLYDGDIVKVWWGCIGGNPPQHMYRYHRLSISKRGRLRLSGVENIVRPKEIEKQFNFIGVLDTIFYEYVK